MQDYKIRIPNREIAKAVQDKAFELGYDWKISTQGVHVALVSECIFLYSDGKITHMPTAQGVFDEHRNPEISYQEFLQLGEAKQQQIYMEELELKLVVAPSRAKNVTVGKSYSGILIDAEDTQVDTFDDAEYFLCENDNGKEARYSIGLFEKPAVPAPYVPSYEEIIDGIVVTETETYSTVNGVNFDLVDSGWGSLIYGDVDCSCGAKTFDGINDLMADIESTVEASDYSFEYPDEETLIVDLFKAIVKEAIDRKTLAFAVFLTTNEDDRVTNAMDGLCEADTASCFTGIKRNPNSGNNIKVWIIAK